MEQLAGGWARIADAHSAMHRPSAIDSEHMVNGAIVSSCAFALLGAFHLLVARRVKRAYFAIHVFANVVISALTFDGAIRALLSPAASTVPVGGASDAIFICWVYALHIYHPVFFRTNRMDWIHHVPTLLLNTLMFSVRCGDAIHLKCLILCGLPGGVDYLLQVLEGEGKLSRARYKHMCANINQWCRIPFGIVAAYAILLGLYHQWALATTYETVVFVLMGINGVQNPLFFGRQAVEANVVDIANRVEWQPGSLKLPRVRALSGKPSKPEKPEAYPVTTGSAKKAA